MTKDLDHQRNINLQAHEHPLVEDGVFKTMEDYILYLMHLKSYEEAREICVGKDVLDWGCNVGYGMEILAGTAASVAGLDLSEQAVTVARQRLGTRARDIQVYDGTRCAFPDQTFDVVTSFQVLEHISDYETYFNELLRVLRPGGLVILATPNAIVRLAPGMKPWNEFHVHEFAPSELREFLAARFSSVTIRGLFATDKFYRIERQRVERAKQDALAAQNPRGIVKSLKHKVKTNVPFALLVRDAILRAYSWRSAESLSPSELKEFSTADAYYREENLDNALDLMAICQNPDRRIRQ